MILVCLSFLNCCSVIAGHCWGTPVTELLDCNSDSTDGDGTYDVLLLADTLWLHDKVAGFVHAAAVMCVHAVVVHIVMQHVTLLQSINSLLSRNGVVSTSLLAAWFAVVSFCCRVFATVLQALVAFSHHVPGHELNDLSFFTKAETLHGLDNQLLETAEFPHVFGRKQQTVYLYAVTRRTVAAVPGVSTSDDSKADEDGDKAVMATK